MTLPPKITELHEREVAQLVAAQQPHIDAVLASTNKTVEWFIDIIVRDVTHLATTVAGFLTYISFHAQHLAVEEVALKIKTAGAQIESTTAALKTQVMGLLAADIGSYASFMFTDDSAHPIIIHSGKDIIETAHTMLGELYESITGMGSYLESLGDITGNVADIKFDGQRIAYMFQSLAAQIVQHVIVIDHTKERIDETVKNSNAAVDRILKSYSAKIAART